MIKSPKYFEFFKENRNKKQSLKIFKLRIKDSNEIYKKFSKDFYVRACPICGFNKSEKQKKFNNRYGVVSCKKCNTLYVNPVPNIKALKYYYNNCKCNNKEYLGSILNSRASKGNLIFEERISFLLKLIKKILNKKKKIKILEVGSHSGAFIKLLTDELSRIKKLKHVDIMGIDIDKKAIKKPVSKNISLHNYSAEDFVKKTNKRFDIILHFELIEHLQDPFKFCNALHNLLNDEGLMYFHTPNSLGLDNMAVTYNDFRPLAHGIFPPMHLNAFNTANITHFLIRTGFKVKSIETPGYFDVDIVKNFAKKNSDWSIMNKIKSKQNLAIIQSLIRLSRASSHMAILAEK